MPVQAQASKQNSQTNEGVSLLDARSPKAPRVSPGGALADELGVTVTAHDRKMFDRLDKALVRNGQVNGGACADMMWLNDAAVPLILAKMKTASPMKFSAYCEVLQNIVPRTANAKVAEACCSEMLKYSSRPELQNGNTRVDSMMTLAAIEGSGKLSEQSQQFVIDRLFKGTFREKFSVSRISVAMNAIPALSKEASMEYTGRLMAMVASGGAEGASAREGLAMAFVTGSVGRIKAAAQILAASKDETMAEVGKDMVERITMATKIKVGSSTLNPFVLNRDALEIAARDFTPKQGDTRPVAVVAIAAHDHNGATFDESKSRIITDLANHRDPKVPNGYRVVVMQIGQDTTKAADAELLLGMKMATGALANPGSARRIDALIMMAHGSHDGVTFGADFYEPKHRFSTSDKGLINSLGKLLSSKAQIVLDSCSGGEYNSNIATALSRVANVQAAGESIAPKTSIEIKNGRIHAHFKANTRDGGFVTAQSVDIPRAL